ncbi:Uncharacterised protein [uncultured archaeon]|nr:Uncharacterised protein [uncultured archaeon]
MAGYKVHVEWEYLVVMFVIVFLAYKRYDKFAPYTDLTHITDIHLLYGIGGAILTVIMLLLMFRTDSYDFGALKIGNFLQEAAAPSLIMGLPIILTVLRTGFYSSSAAAPTPGIIFIGTACEELLRIAIYFLFAVGFGSPKVAIGASGIGFAAMHLFWNPSDWINAIVVGVLFSVMIYVFNCFTGLIVAHFAYDYLAFGYMNVWLYVIIFCIVFISGYALSKSKYQVRV